MKVDERKDETVKESRFPPAPLGWYARRMLALTAAMSLAALTACDPSQAATVHQRTPTAAPRTSTAAAKACQLADLKVRAGGPNAGGTLESLPVEATNTGKAPCSLSGYPRIVLIDSKGRVLPTHETHELTVRAKRVVVVPRGHATSWVTYTGIANGNTFLKCPAVVAMLSVQLPGDRGTATTRLPAGSPELNPCGGNISVGPMLPGAPS
jgi:hypothetical protein